MATVAGGVFVRCAHIQNPEAVSSKAAIHFAQDIVSQDVLVPVATAELPAEALAAVWLEIAAEEAVSAAAAAMAACRARSLELAEGLSEEAASNSVVSKPGGN